MKVVSYANAFTKHTKMLAVSNFTMAIKQHPLILLI